MRRLLETFAGLRSARENVTARGEWTNLQSDDAPSPPAEPVVSSRRLPVVTRGDTRQRFLSAVVGLGRRKACSALLLMRNSDEAAHIVVA